LEVKTHKAEGTQTKAHCKEGSREETVLRVENGIVGIGEVVFTAETRILSWIEQQTNTNLHQNNMCTNSNKCQQFKVL
jgi:hypothetical protein